MENSFPSFCPKKYYFSLYNDLKVELKCFFLEILKKTLAEITPNYIFQKYKILNKKISHDKKIK